MSFKILAAAAAILTIVATSAAEARKSPQNERSNQDQSDDDEARPVRQSRVTREVSEERRERRQTKSSARNRDNGDGEGGRERHSGVGPKPGAWCGWYMRTRHGGGPELNLAANWRHYGRPSSPQVGAIVVWPHHVGEIVGRASDGQWIVLSGNDGNAVKRRPRSIAGAVIRA